MSVTTRRQRGSAAAAGAARGAATADEPPHTAQPTRWDYARFAALQHSGLALCVLGLALMACGYGRQWVHDTHLSLVSLALCLLGLFMHETRPYKVRAALGARGTFQGLFQMRRPCPGHLANRSSASSAPHTAHRLIHTHPLPSLRIPTRWPQRDDEFKQQMAGNAGGKDE